MSNRTDTAEYVRALQLAANDAHMLRAVAEHLHRNESLHMHEDIADAEPCRYCWLRAGNALGAAARARTSQDTAVYQLRTGTPDDIAPMRLGLYANQNAAKLHGFAEHERHHGAADLMWRHDDEDDDGVLRLYARTVDGEELPTSWHIVPLAAAAEYDPQAEG